MTTREEFEAWWMAPNGVRILGIDNPLSRDGNKYYWPSVQDAWEIWKASRNAALEEAAKICDEKDRADIDSGKWLWQASKCAEQIRALKD